MNRAQDLYDRGLFVQSYAALQPYGPPLGIEGTAARLLMARLAGNLEAPRLFVRLAYHAFRNDRSDALAQYFYVFAQLERRGPLAAWRALRRLGEPVDASPKLRSDWLSSGGRIAAILRDFALADRWSRRAEEIAPDNAWVFVERAAIMGMADRYDDALEAARYSLQLRPDSCAGMQSVCHFLKLMGHDDEAVALLEGGVPRVECPRLTLDLATTLVEREDYNRASEMMERYKSQAVLIEPEVQRRISAVQSGICYFLGDYAGAARFARATSHRFHKTLAERIEAPGDGSKRVLLPVKFVRQHHTTCAPVTLAAIAQYWSVAVDHLNIAEEICYDGTPAYNERNWATENGWIAREFTVTWESATALLDRGAPFTLTTNSVRSAHLQAVIGYDTHRGTLLLRDPFYAFTGEALIPDFLIEQRPYGPRGMVLVPISQADRLDGIVLPDSDLFDQFHALSMSLLQYERDAAWKAYEAMRDSAPHHRLTVGARRSIAWFDSDLTEQLRGAEEMLELFPDEPNTILNRLNILQNLGRRVDNESAIVECCHAAEQANTRERRINRRTERESCLEAQRKGRTITPSGKESSLDAPATIDDISPSGKESVDYDSDATQVMALPLYWQHYADLLSEDSRRHVAALSLLRRGLRRQPLSAAIIHSMAGISWAMRDFNEAEELYKFAALLEDKNEQFSRNYFLAARSQKHAADALDVLRDRFARFGNKSGLPARTLFNAYESLGRLTDAYPMLDEALKRRPNDEMLRLFAAEKQAEIGEFETAGALLTVSRFSARDTAWNRVGARIATLRRDRTSAIDLWRSVLEVQPLAIDAHQALTRLLAEHTGEPAVRTHLESAATRFPFHFEIHRLWVQWLRDFGDQSGREHVLRRMVELNPNDAWTRRELAAILTNEHKFTEAHEQCRASAALDPHSTFHFNVLADIYVGQADWREARMAYREAVRLNADNGYAISRLVRLGATAAERRAELEFIEAEMERQTLQGEGLFAYRNTAMSVLHPEQLLANLEKALAARPDLCAAWSSVIQQQVAAGSCHRALETALEAAERFPLNAQIWMDLAEAHVCAGDYDAEQAALLQALEIRPGWTAPTRELCISYERQAKFDQSRRVMLEAIERAPLDARNYAVLADFEWRRGNAESAFKNVRSACDLDTDHEWAWMTLIEWAEVLGRAEEARALVRGAIDRNPYRADLWVRLARALSGSLEEQLSALRRAVEISPRFYDAYDQTAILLAKAGRHDEALQACAADGTGVPSTLAGRAAWVMAQAGDVAKAIASMKELLGSDPRYYTGWSLLAGWLKEMDRTAEYRDAAQKLIALRPGDSFGFGVLGDAEFRLGNRDAARDCFLRAIDLSPSNSYAIRSLIRSHLLDYDSEHRDEPPEVPSPFQGAGWRDISNPALRSAWELFERHQAALAENGWRECVAVHFAAIGRDETVAADQLMRLAHVPKCAGALSEAVFMMRKSGYGRTAEAVLRPIARDESVDGDVADIWFNLAVGIDGFAACADSLALLPAAAGRAAASAHLRELAHAKKPASILAFLEKHRQWLRSDDELWGFVGFALSVDGLRHKARDWMADWESRSALQSWVLVNYAEDLRYTGRAAEAARISRHALSLSQRGGRCIHDMWLAFDSGLTGDFAACAAVLDRIDEKLENDYLCLRYVIEALAALAPSGSSSLHPASRTTTFRSAKARLTAARKLIPSGKPAWLYGRIWNAAVVCISRRIKSPLWRTCRLKCRRVRIL